MRPESLASILRVTIKKFGGLKAVLSWLGHQGVAAYQRFHGLTDTGKLDLATLRHMVARITRGCSHADVMRVDFRRDRWASNKVTWQLNASVKLPTMTNDEMAEGLEWAWRQWAEVADLEFTRVKSGGNIVVGVVAGPNGTGRPGGTLAYAGLANIQTRQVPLMFDASEEWTPLGKSGRGINFSLTGLHEGGHALGIEHRPGSDAQHGGSDVMEPIYDGRVVTLGTWDRRSVVGRYGEATAVTPPPPPDPNRGKLWTCEDGRKVMVVEV